jgi:limonene 1,2-monooxygenase
MHIAETREQAERDVEHGIVAFAEYFGHVLPGGPVQGSTVEEILENNRAGGFAVIGTPDDAAARIAELVAASDGGFGAYLFLDHDWAAPTAKRRSYELFAEYVMPRFQGHLEPRAASKDWLTGSAGEFVNRATHAIAKATEDHAAERAARA